MALSKEALATAPKIPSSRIDARPLDVEKVLKSLELVPKYRPVHPVTSDDITNYGGVSLEDLDVIKKVESKGGVMPHLVVGKIGRSREEVLISMTEDGPPDLLEVEAKPGEDPREAIKGLVEESTNLTVDQTYVFATRLRGDVRITVVDALCSSPPFQEPMLPQSLLFVRVAKAANGLGLPEDNRNLMRLYQSDLHMRS